MYFIVGAGEGSNESLVGGIDKTLGVVEVNDGVGLFVEDEGGKARGGRGGGAVEEFDCVSSCSKNFLALLNVFAFTILPWAS